MALDADGNVIEVTDGGAGDSPAPDDAAGDVTSDEPGDGGDAGAPDQAAGGDTPAPVKKGAPGAERRIKELSAKAKYWEDVATGKIKPAPASAAPVVDDSQPKPMPTPEQYTDYASFQTAERQWLLDEAERRAVVKIRTEQGRQSVQSKYESMQSKISEAARTDEDLQGAMSDVTFVQSSAVGELIAESADPAALVKHLYVNRDVLDRINRLTPVQAAREIGRIEAAITSPGPAVKVKSNAPPPIKPIIKEGEITHTDDDEKDTSTWMAEERKRQAAARSGRIAV